VVTAADMTPTARRRSGAKEGGGGTGEGRGGSRVSDDGAERMDAAGAAGRGAGGEGGKGEKKPPPELGRRRAGTGRGRGRKMVTNATGKRKGVMLWERKEGKGRGREGGRGERGGRRRQGERRRPRADAVQRQGREPPSRPWEGDAREMSLSYSWKALHPRRGLLSEGRVSEGSESWVPEENVSPYVAHEVQPCDATDCCRRPGIRSLRISYDEPDCQTWRSSVCGEQQAGET
jgi:hypothetical protein